MAHDVVLCVLPVCEDVRVVVFQLSISKRGDKETSRQVIDFLLGNYQLVNL